VDLCHNWDKTHAYSTMAMGDSLGVPVSTAGHGRESRSTAPRSTARTRRISRPGSAPGRPRPEQREALASPVLAVGTLKPTVEPSSRCYPHVHELHTPEVQSEVLFALLSGLRIHIAITTPDQVATDRTSGYAITYV